MDLRNLHPSPGSTHPKKRLGRGPGSGHGKTAGRGHKGKGARSGGNVKPGYEGGQMPLQRRLPKRGFKPIARTSYAVVNLGRLGVFDAGSSVGPDDLCARGLLRRRRPVNPDSGPRTHLQPARPVRSAGNATSKTPFVAVAHLSNRSQISV